MKTLRALLLTLAVGLTTVSSAQSLSSAYFLDGSLYRWQLNPAIQNEKNYFSFPALGNLMAGVNGNVGLNDFLYPYNKNGYSLTTFMSGTVDANEFLGRIPDMAKLREGLDLTFFSVGFRGLGGYNTIHFSMHERMGLNVPKSFFQFAKQGLQHDSYSFADLGVGAEAYADFSLGHSHSIGDNLKVGATLKLLMGLGFADVNVDKLNVELNESQWQAESSAHGTVGLPMGAVIKFDDKGMPSKYRFNPLPASFGAGIDLGVAYDLSDAVEGLGVSAAMTGLGFVGWKSTYSATVKSSQFAYSGMGEIDPSQDLDDQFDTLMDDVSGLFNIGFAEGDAKKVFFAPTLRLGAEYEMPFYDKLSAGLLLTHHTGGFFSSTEGRLYANVSPTSWFGASINGGVSTYGASFGWMIDFHPNGIAFFLGSDCTVLNVTPQFIPVGKLNANVSMGINFPL